ncbi:DNA repair ATPase [Photobacterium sp. SDRW27]|uniref:DNA repair ATPase n=1 Tax=Photobacterium obscurum TaxID=2829490 RepID=UPI0022431690|nr:DNA repair ATPase [Photobacterium obscurum]MCW8330769.1 DNA repair ATPase [Photobacterium obscurum]
MTEPTDNAIDKAVSEAGAYEVLKSRLSQQGESLKDLAQAFNTKRQETFGGSEFALTGKANVQTDTRSIPVDMAQVNGQLLFGYQVYMGLKTAPALSDVFGLYNLSENDDTYRIEPLGLDNSFLSDPQFNHEFTELFTYYKDARLSQISRHENMLYLAFQIGMRAEDRKVFRFEIRHDGVRYLDANGQQALTAALQHDFEWTDTTRDNHISGEHPHVSVKDRLFVECVGGDLTIKVENNTAQGQGIYAEPVDDAYQTIADAEIAYAEVGELIVLKVLPNREKDYRYFIYNPLNQQVVRADAIGISAKALPEDHGILYSHGYVLTNGETKQFDEYWQGLRFFKHVSSPNGEDLLYFFFDVERGSYVLYTYNLIEKAFSSPMHSHGYSVYPDGRMLMFKVSENAEASTIHPLRIWQTPFTDVEHYAQKNRPGADPFLVNLGNAELVRALSSLLSICQLAQADDVSQAAYESLLKTCQTTLDHYHWLKHTAAIGLGEAVNQLMATADRIIDEFAKVRQLQLHAEKALEQQQTAVSDLVGMLKLAPRDEANTLLTLLAQIKSEVGNVMALRQHRYMPEHSVVAMQEQLDHQRQSLNEILLGLLQEEKAYRPYKQDIASIEDQLLTIEKTAELATLQQRADKVRAQLALVTEEVAEIETDDPTQATRILDLTTEVTAKLNAISARLRQKQQALRGDEAKAEFSSQFKLLAQAVNSAMEQAQTPEQCDDQLAKLIGQLEKLESRFADFDEFLTEIYAKRDEIQSTLEGHKQQLVTAQQRRIQNLNQAADVTFKSIEKRVARFEDVAALNSFFATDNMVQKLHQLSQSICDLGDSVKADAIDSRIKAAQDQALRALRDNKDIFEQGGKVLRLGKHRFSVNQQALDLSLVEHSEALSLHISGTEYYEPVTDQAFLELQSFAKLDVSSETETVYRAEYLAYSLLRAAQQRKDGLAIDDLLQASKGGVLLKLIQSYAAPRYREGYVKGVHDHDAEKVLSALLPCYQQAGLLRFDQASRANALLWLVTTPDDQAEQWRKQATNAMLMKQHLSSDTAFEAIKASLADQMPENVPCSREQSADYAIQLLGQSGLQADVSRDAIELCDVYLSFRRSLGWQPEKTVDASKFADHLQWLSAYAKHQQQGLAFVTEAAALATIRDNNRVKLHAVDFSLQLTVTGLLGEHPRVNGGELVITLDDFLLRCQHHDSHTIPQYDAYLKQRAALLEVAKRTIRLNEFNPRPLTSFVRNKLISESYLPLIGDNLAKQMGALGDNKRTDLMGMLLLISPPGYGKTTLIEYVAHKLGLVFMKINGPSIGHEVTSLDPKDAPDQNAAREVEKINLAFEMGNNVLLYLDDIQHTNPEFLQKFISLCDGTRRVEGSWKGETKTYDMRGKKFAVVMAGNPYTESGDVFKIPDMLANRADIYNLGDMLSDQKSAFELSFIENSLTSNAVLAPLATRDLNDLYQLIAMANGEKVALSDLAHPYSATEANEIVATLEKLLKVQRTVLKVNQQYIASAATADEYRVEPPFKLQGSYRNMNKLGEKISAVMTDDELQTLLQDHYQGEAQTLTAGTEENLLKLAELRGEMTDEQQQRWQLIKDGYCRKQQVGDSNDRAGQMVQQMVALNQNLTQVARTLTCRSDMNVGKESGNDKV